MGVANRLEASNRTQLKQLAATERRLAMMELRKDPTVELGQMKSYRDTDDRLIEEFVSQAVAAVLEDATIVHSTRYEYMGWAGDLDGMVTGTFEGKAVVVFIEAKHNMDTSYRNAQSELNNAKQYWEKLASTPIETLDDREIVDFEALKVDEYRDSRVMLAFGGSKFSQHVARNKFNGMAPWLHVVANSYGRFVAELFVNLN
jgi:hypothetical protein